MPYIYNSKFIPIIIIVVVITTIIIINITIISLIIETYQEYPGVFRLSLAEVPPLYS
jgi:hypothetical protein